MSSTVARAVTELLIDAGVSRAYTVPGESFLELLSEWESDPRTRLISTRHEAGASFMAEADGKLTGQVGLAFASRGPGAANLSIGVHTAMQDQTPMLVILGQVASDERGRESFQEVDLASFYAPIAKWTAEAAAPSEVTRLVAEGIVRARSGRPGPVAVSVPADFWGQEYAESDQLGTADYTPPDRLSTEEAVAQLAHEIHQSRRAVVIAGPGDRIGRDALRRVAEAYGLGVYVAFRRQDAFDESHPNFLGHLRSGLAPDVYAALDEADLVIVLGTRLDAMTSQHFRYPKSSQRLIMVGPGLEAPCASSPALVLNTDPHAVLTGLQAYRGARDTVSPKWDRYHSAWMQYVGVKEIAPRTGVNPGDVVRAIRKLAPSDAIVTSDAGNFAGFLQRYWSFSTRHRLLAPANGAMGYGMPAAVAAKLIEPARTVVAMVGDGGIMMTGQEIETAVRYGAAVLAVAFRNGLYGTIAMNQAQRIGGYAGVTIGPLDLAGWARSLGAVGLSIEESSEIEPTIRTALSCEAPCVIDVRMDPDIISPQRRLSTISSRSLGHA